ncbi:class I adenylate-forming enzyme family protein [Desertimonas flava]|jgi:crotonobetaine/carnitine-CoA ligase|uniref:class I adenylate-forming enzyme family protein n=1 Tax=Desertimonas flava TaxID=2064846 RepID=UPI000E353154|nr:class I adenylate-forming enzyme family protein [Desertimonas flava]
MTPRAPAVPGFAELWQLAVDECGRRPFLIFEDVDGAVSDFTYGDMDRLVRRVAGGLTARGVGAGDAVHLVLPNTVAFVAVWLACSALGAWIVPSDPRAGVAELAEHLRRTTPRVAVTTPRREADLLAACDLAPGVTTEVVAVDERDVTLGRLATAEPVSVPATVDPMTRLAVMFTSGTTSAPKGVVLTQANYAYAGLVMAASSSLTRFDRQLVVLPLFHANAQYYSFAAAIAAGASVALIGAFSASRFVEQARRHEVTHASLFAAPIRMILARTPEDTAPLKLRNAWFAQNLSADQYARTAELLGCTPRQIYGMTETVPAVLSNPLVGAVPSAIGRPTLGCAVRVVGPSRTAVALDEEGAIHVGGVPGVTVFAEYLDDPDTTAAAIVEETADGFVWFDTGDRATVDGRGMFHFAGRRSDVLKVAGENVSVVEVEHVLAEHPAVGDVAVVGRPDPMRDEVPVAYVVAAEGAPKPAELDDELRAWVAERLAPSKRPAAYHFVDDLPRTSVGKIRKFLLGAEPTAAADGDELDADDPGHDSNTTPSHASNSNSKSNSTDNSNHDHNQQGSESCDG